MWSAAGPGFGVAQEAALKLKETCGLHAEAFSAAEVRHGPWRWWSGFSGAACSARPTKPAPASKNWRTNSPRRRDACSSPAARLRARRLPTPPRHPLIEPMLLIQASTAWPMRWRWRRGLDPDRPPHLNKGDRDASDGLALVNGRCARRRASRGRAVLIDGGRIAAVVGAREVPGDGRAPSTWRAACSCPASSTPRSTAAAACYSTMIRRSETIATHRPRASRFGTTGFLPTLISDDLHGHARRHRSG